jgi:hypothetical protein
LTSAVVTTDALVEADAVSVEGSELVESAEAVAAADGVAVAFAVPDAAAATLVLASMVAGARGGQRRADGRARRQHHRGKTHGQHPCRSIEAGECAEHADLLSCCRRQAAAPIARACGSEAVSIAHR